MLEYHGFATQEALHGYAHWNSDEICYKSDIQNEWKKENRGKGIGGGLLTERWCLQPAINDVPHGLHTQ